MTGSSKMHVAVNQTTDCLLYTNMEQSVPSILVLITVMKACCGTLSKRDSNCMRMAFLSFFFSLRGLFRDSWIKIKINK